MHSYRGTTALTNCTVSSNTAGYDGGGLANFGTATLTNCTISANSAGFDGGGLANFGTTTLTAAPSAATPPAPWAADGICAARLSVAACMTALRRRSHLPTAPSAQRRPEWRRRAGQPRHDCADRLRRQRQHRGLRQRRLRVRPRRLWLPRRLRRRRREQLWRHDHAD